MKIHSHTITDTDIYNVATKVGVTFGRFSPSGSRSHALAYDVIISGSARHKSQGNPHIQAATYDEWGWFISHLYDIDTEAKIGPYKNSADFAKQTDWKFDTD